MNRDNQQTKLQFDLGWMSAIIDGEGWLIFNRQYLPSKNYRYVPVIGMNNTSLILTDRMESLLKEWGIGVWRGKRNFTNLKHKRQYVINIRGFKRCEKLLKIISDCLFEKKEQARLIKEYIEYRKSLPIQSPCGGKEEAFYQKLKRLNQKQSFND